MFKKIVVGLDGSETSENALRMACDLARKYESEIHLVHAPQPQTVAFALGAVPGYHTATTMPSPAEVKQAGEKILEAGKTIVEGYQQAISGTHMEVAEPADYIVDCAKACGADLIVTGRRGLGSIGALVQGSTTQRVNHLAECACLSVM